MFQTKIVENIKTHILYSITFSENRVVYEIMWKKIGRTGEAKNNIRWCMPIECWINMATFSN